ncbi:CocE/NonD family hydrolase [Streptomyces sp. NPDC005648]|uniref:CocE/NonD family hydrolase n=1 Tax=Streptomyces sp. NPDC005648 TaxID=3157044 RepID=UPI0033A36ADE
MDTLPTGPVVDIEKDVPCRMRDGVVLRADVYRPRTGEPLPVLVMRLPYGKRMWAAEGVPSPGRLAAAGYVVVVQDVRGRFASEGRFTPNVHEPEDGYDTLAWAATLPGANGVVGTFGPSYLAHVQWAAALEGPEALRSMVTMVSPNHSALDGYVVRGGVIELGSRLGWAYGSIGPGETDRDPGPLPARRLESLQQRFDSGEIYRERPFRELVEREPFLGPALDAWSRPLTELADDPTMTAGRYDRIEQPVFVIGGWFDAFLGSTLAQFQGMQDRPGRRRAQLVVGPWSHMQAGSRLGDLDFGPSASHTDMGDDLSLEEQHIRWFDATLKGADGPLADVAPVRLFVMGSNTWSSFTEFPPRQASPQPWFLRAGGGLSRTRPEDAGSASYRYDPQDPAPTVGGATLMLGHEPGPLDQRALHDRADVLSFVSEPLDEPLTVVGYVAVTLIASTSAPDTDFVVRLCDDHPGGPSIAMADGIIRVGARDSYDHGGLRPPVPPSPVIPGQAYEYRFNLWATAHTFLPGHRLRVDVTSSSFPRWDPNLNTGRSSWDRAHTETATQTVHLGGSLASHITLPVLPTARTTTQRSPR